MKNNYLVLLVLAFCLNAAAQVNWARKGGLWAYDYGYGVVTDNTGNIYVAGKFEYNAIFGAYTANCQGNHDAYILKYSPNGTEQWLKTAGGPNGDYAWGISTDKTNYLYVAGEIEGTSPIVFQGSTVTLTGAGDNDVFVSKWDLDGNVIWAKREGVVTSEKALSVTNDNSGNVYICGYFTDNSNFNGSAVTGFGGRDIFVAKYDGNGTFQWVQKAGGSGRDEAKCIRADNNGNLYICGMYTGNTSFGTIAMTTSDGTQDSYVAKLSASDGSFQWVKKGDAVLDDVAWSLTMDNAGSVYVTGEFNSYISFQDGTKGYATTGATNVYVAKLDGSGNVQWIKGGGGSMLDRARGIGTDGTTIYLTGQFGGSATFGSFGVTAPDSSDVFIAAMDNSGNYLWVGSGGGPADTPEPLGYESGIAITGQNGMVYATGGMLRDTSCASCPAIDFNGHALTGYSRDDMFIVALGSAQGVGLPHFSADGVRYYPNPADQAVFVEGREDLECAILDINGCMVRKTGTGHVSVADLPSGVYLLELKSDKSVSHQKLIVQH